MTLYESQQQCTSVSIFKGLCDDDVIVTPKGVGLVVGMTDSNVGVHLTNDDGVSFFTPQAIYDPNLFQLKHRRAIPTALRSHPK